MVKKRKVNKETVFGFDNLNYDEESSTGVEMEFQEFGKSLTSSPKVREGMLRSKFKDFPIGFRNFCKDLNLFNIRKVHYIKSEWESFENLEDVSAGYVVYRGLFLGFFLFAVSYSMSHTVPINIFFIYLTNWSLLIQLLYGLLFFCNVLHALVISVKQKRKRIGQQVGKFKEIQVISNAEIYGPPPVQETMSSEATLDPEQRYLSLLRQQPSANCVERTISLLFSITGTLPLFVGVGYWIFIYDPNKVSNFGMTFIVHAMNGIIALIDVMIIAIPVRVTHFVYIGLFAAVYIFFTKLYDSLHGQYFDPQHPYIYSLLDWRFEWTYMITILGVIIIIVLYQYLWFMYTLRLFLVSSWVKGKKEMTYWIHQIDYTRNKEVCVQCPKCGTVFQTTCTDHIPNQSIIDTPTIQSTTDTHDHHTRNSGSSAIPPHP